MGGREEGGWFYHIEEFMRARRGGQGCSAPCSLDPEVLVSRTPRLNSISPLYYEVYEDTFII